MTENHGDLLFIPIANKWLASGTDEINKTLTTRTPTYVQPILSPYIPPHNLWSSGDSPLDKPQYSSGPDLHAFHVAGSKVWNRQQTFLSCSNSFSSFKKCLKTYLFSLVFKHLNIYLLFGWRLTNWAPDSYLYVILQMLAIKCWPDNYETIVGQDIVHVWCLHLDHTQNGLMQK